ncbi:hypothetical protein [Microlunatus speluncae]|uniref:hypothetical protein n=1 Tax=Microlunatus speluncae TaxID=2594267 RepID=UPI0012665A21|nr:hypothetical protein [Microlunatus speluncae]
MLSGGCLLPRRGPEPDPTPDPFPATQQVIDALRQLVDQTGRDAIQSLELRRNKVAVTLLMADGETLRFTRSEAGPWDNGAKPAGDHQPTTSTRLNQLPLQLLSEFVAHAGPEAEALVFELDDTGRLRIWADDGVGDFDRAGIKVDGTGRVPTVDLSDPTDVAGAIEEIVEAYGSRIYLVSADKYYVHADLNLDGRQHGVRVVRHPRESPYQIDVIPRHPESWLFDPVGIDPTLAIELLPTIARQADLAGKATDWQFSRPTADSDPHLSFRVSEDGPTDPVVWVNQSGKIIKITRACDPDGGWCPR